MVQLPSKHQIGDYIWLTLWSKWMPVDVVAVKFTGSQVKYDVRCSADDGEEVRLYNIDEKVLQKYKTESQS